VGTNACWIQVALRGTTREQVIATIDDYWVSRGATRGPNVWRKLESAGGLAKSRSLGIAISPDESGWVTVCDSERYSADYALAQHLAETLAARVRFVGTWDVSQAEVDEYLGPGDSECSEWPYTYYDKREVDESAGWSFLSFDDVDASLYDDGDELVAYADEPYDDDDDDDDDNMEEPDPPSGYLVLNPGEPVADPVVAHDSMWSALAELAQRGAGAELVFVDGNVDAADARTSGVALAQTECVARHATAAVFEAWLVAVVMESADVDAADETMRTGRFEQLTELLATWSASRDEISDRTLLELGWLARLPPDMGSIDELVRRIDSGDNGDDEASIRLERTALVQRDAAVFRFARRLNEHNYEAADQCRRRIRLG
jgi:hypothetical protein